MILENIGSQILKRLQSRYSIRNEDLLQPVTLFPVVTLVSQIDELLAVSKADTDTSDISAAASWLAIYTVPAKKRWKVKFIARDGSLAASMMAFIIGGVQIAFDAPGTGATNTWVNDVILDEGDTISRLTTGNAGDNARTTIVIYTEYDAY